MRYIDTSILLAYLTPEAGSGAAEALMQSIGEPIAISTWTETELLSALGVKIRSRQIRRSHAEDIVEHYSRYIAPILRRFEILDRDHKLATVLMHGWAPSLRAGDALHLALAARHCAELFTFDRIMAKSAAKLGIDTTLLKF